MNQNKLTKIVGLLLVVMLVLAVFTSNGFAANEVTKNEVATNDVKTIGAGDTTKAEEGTVEATFTDFSNAKFSVTRDKDKNFIFNVTGTTLKQDTGRSYYLFLTNEKEEPEIKYRDSGYLNDDGIGKTCIYLRSNSSSIGSYLTDRLEKAGDIYVTIVEYDGSGYVNAIGTGANPKDFHKTVVTKKKLERPATLPLTNRMTGYFFEEYSTIFDWEIGGNGERKCNIKVGRITDNNILRAIKNGEKNCLSNLMSYAKKTDALYQTQLKADYSLNQKSIIGQFPIVDGAYYFVYFSLDTENGKYYPIEDVMLYQGYWTNVKFLCNYLDDRFVWNIEDENPPSAPANNIVVSTDKPVTNSNKPTSVTGNIDNTKASGKIPQTGSIPTVALGILVVITLVGGVAYYQNRKYRGI